MNSTAKTQIEIAKVCDEIKSLLLAKNNSYGNSALEPVRVFSKSSTVEQILVRIDDKLSRIQRGSGLLASDEDVVNDLIGYLVLLKIAIKEQDSTPKVTYDDIITFGRDFEATDSMIDSFGFAGVKSGFGKQDQWDGTDIEPFCDKLAYRCPD